MGDLDKAKQVSQEMLTNVKGVSVSMLPIWPAIIQAAEDAGLWSKQAYAEVQLSSKATSDAIKVTLADTGINMKDSMSLAGAGFKDSMNLATEAVRASSISAKESAEFGNQSVAFGWIGFGNDLLPRVSEAANNVARVAASISAIPSIPQFMPQVVPGVPSGGGGGLSGVYSGSGHTATFATNYGTLTGATATYAASVARGTVTRKYSGGFINEEIFGIGQRTGKPYTFGELGRREIVIPQGGNVSGHTFGGSGGGGLGRGDINVTVPLQVINGNNLNAEDLAFKIKKAIKDEIDRYSRV
jgi:hypothetical protein